MGVPEELSSWLGDDVCANCGATAQPNHLYCSQECKEEDAKQIDSGKSALAPKSAPALSSTTKIGSTPFWTEANDSNSNRFRYPCPTSPSIVPKYNSALTSPALVALERSLPNTAPTSTTDRSSHSISSSGESSSAAQAKSSKRRSSSRSTFSSASDAISTEHSTPQSNSEAIQDEEDALDDFHLPPSIRPSSILLSSTAREAKMAATLSTSVTPDGAKHSPASKITSTSHQRTLSNKAQHKTDMAGNNTIAFARRPSTTNLPPALALASPMLRPYMSPTMNSSRITTRRQSARHSQGTLQEAQATLRGRKSTTVRAIPSPAAFAQSASKAMGASALDVVSQHRKDGAAISPPCIASASSSAGKTLRALSPQDTDANQANICGRYGCCGLGSDDESLDHDAVNDRRPSLSRGHKHTHSAAAGLNSLYNQGTSSLAANAGLFLDPSSGQATASAVRLGSTEEKGSSFEERLRNPPRGRSKARGRRSTSHRSPSPGRGAGRRVRSEDLMKSVVDEAALSSPSNLPGSARLQPIALLQARRSPVGREGIEDDDDDGRRGRSLTERDVPLQLLRSRQREETTSTLKGAERLEDSCEMAWPAYGHDMYERQSSSSTSKAKLAQKIATALIHGSKGYDDVDLDEL